MNHLQRAMIRLKALLRSFLLQTASPVPLALLRVGTCGILIFQAVSIRDYLYPLMGSYGIIQLKIRDSMTLSSLPRIEWLLRPTKLVNLGETAGLYLIFVIYIFFLTLLALGLFTRTTALFAWLLHLTFNTSGIASTYGVYEFTNIALFYCFVMPVGDAFSLDAWRRPARPDRGIQYALSRRVLQCHLCIVYFSSGLEKAMGIQWWNGEAIWRALMREDVHPSFSWLAALPPVAMAMCWSTLVVELGYAVFIWQPKTRRLWLSLTVLLHLGIGIFLGLWFFAATMIVLNLAAFYSFRRVPAVAEDFGPVGVGLPELQSGSMEALKSIPI